MRELAMSRQDEQTLIVTTSVAMDAGGFDPNCRGVLRSRDGGASWHALNAGLAWPQAGPLAIDPKNDARLVIGVPGTGMHRSLDRRLRCDRETMSVASGGFASFAVQAPPHELYFILASTSGSIPGTPMERGMILPLNADAFTMLSLRFANSALFINTLARADGQGRAQALVAFPASLLRPLLGREITFAYLSTRDVSNAVSITLTR